VQGTSTATQHRLADIHYAASACSDGRKTLNSVQSSYLEIRSSTIDVVAVVEVCS
jgi:hypothetical protein